MDDVLEKRILEILSNDAGMTQAEIAKATGTGLATVQRIMRQMADQGIIVRVGGDDMVTGKLSLTMVFPKIQNISQNIIVMF